MDRQKLRERLAAYAHDEAWARWMKYVRSIWQPTKDGDVVIPREYVERWNRQMDAPYNNLPSKEKRSDRRQADKIMEIIEDFVDGEEATEAMKEPGSIPWEEVKAQMARVEHSEVLRGLDRLLEQAKNVAQIRVDLEDSLSDNGLDALEEGLLSLNKITRDLLSDHIEEASDAECDSSGPEVLITKGKVNPRDLRDVMGKRPILTMLEEAYILFVDLSPAANWSHPCLWIAVDEQSNFSATRWGWPPGEADMKDFIKLPTGHVDDNGHLIEECRLCGSQWCCPDCDGKELP